MKPDTPKIIVAAILGFVVVVGILAGYNPFEVLLPQSDERAPGTWVNAPLSSSNQNKDQEIEGEPRTFPESRPKDIELE